MKDKDLIDWITSVNPESDNMPVDTGTRVIRLLKILISAQEQTVKPRRGRPPKERLQVKEGKIVQ